VEGFGFWALAGLAAILVGLSKGGLPAIGVLGVPVLSLAISPVTAAGLLLPVYVVSDVFGLWAYRHAFDRRVLAILVPATTLGIGLGWATAALVPERAVTGLVGLIGVAYALNLILRGDPSGPARRARVLPGMFWGTVTGFTSFVSHSGGPPYQVYTLPLRMEKMVFAGTSTVLFAYVNAAKLLPYWALGQFTPANLKAAALLMAPAAVAVLAGVRLVRVIPSELFFRIVTWALLAISVRLLYQAVAGA